MITRFTTALKNLLIIIGLFSSQLLLAQTPPDGLVGEDLRDWIKENFYDSKHSSLGYTNARKQMYSTIDVQTDGEVYCVYTGFHQEGEDVSFLDPINAEHSIPQSWFNESSIPRSDIHHLFPTHKDVNSARSNYPFDEVTDSQTDKWYIVNGSNNGLTILTSIPSSSIDSYSELLNNTEFEPREDHKGDLARAAFYFYTMYPGVASSGSSSSGQGIISDLADPDVLYQWHLNDPVDAWELQRNDRTETAQGNRNPYIDNPGWVEDAFGFEGSNSNITISGTINDFGSVDNGNNSSSQSYTISGNGLTANVVVTAPSNFEVSSDDTNFSSNITYAFADVNASAQNVYVRFSPSSGTNGLISGSIVNSSTGTSSVSVSVSGTESGNAIAITEIIDIKNAIDGNGEPTTTGEVNIQGVFYGANTNPGGFDFQYSLIDATAGINIRYDNGASDLGTYAEGDEVIITGTVNHFNGLMQITPTAITEISSGNSRKTPDVVSELNESTESDLVKISNVTIPNSSEWTGTSGNSSSFNVSIEVDGTSFTLRVDGDTELAEMTYSEVFGSETTNINVIGLGGQFDSSSPYTEGYQILPYLASDLIVGAVPTITTSVSSLNDFGSVDNGNSSSAQTYTVSGTDLTADVTITAPTNFEVSTDGSNFSSSVTLAFADVNASAQTIHARFSPSSGNNETLNGNITHTSTNASTVNVSVSGTESGNAGNNAPTDINLSSNNIDENQNTGTMVGELSTTDNDSGDSHTYSLVSGDGDTNNDSFSIDGSNLNAGETFNHETQDSYSIRIKTDDGNGGSYEETFTILINDLNDTPSELTISNATIADNSPSGTSVGLFSTTDEDTSDSHSYTFVSGDGDTDNASFSIEDNELKTDVITDISNKASYNIRVQSDDGNGGTLTHEFTITVTENNGSLFAQDFESESSDNWSYTADPTAYNVSGNDVWDVVESLNSITPQNESKFWGMRDLENDNGGGDFDHTLTFENVDISSYIDVQIKFYYYAIGYEDADSLKYEVFEDDISLGEVALAKDTQSEWVEVTVDINNSASLVKLVLKSRQNGGSDYAGYDNITLTGTSGTASTLSSSVSSLNDFGEVENGNNSSSQTYTVSGSDLTEDVTVTAPSNFEVSTDGSNFTSSVILGFEDVNSGDQTIHARFSPLSGSDGSQTGNITHSSTGVTTVNVSVSGTETGNNQVPTDINLSSNSLNENEEIGTSIGTLTTSDEDENDTHTYTLVSGDGDSGNASFIVEGNILKSGESFNFEVQESYSIRIKTDDNNGGTFEKPLTISINDINDAPFVGFDFINQIANEDASYSYQFDEETFEDEDSDEMTYAASLSDDSALPTWLSFAPASRTFSGTPANENVGTIIIKVIANDGNGGTAFSTFELEVINTNDAPEFNSTPILGVLQDVNYIYNIEASDVDNGASLTISAISKPDWLTFTDNENGTASLSGTPTNSEVGDHNVVLNLTDGIISTPIEQSFTISVVNSNEAPEFTSNPISSVNEDIPYEYNVSATDSDAGANLTLAINDLPEWLTFNDNGNGSAILSGTALDAHVGTHNITISLTDGIISEPIEQNFTITVGNVNDAPSFTPGENIVINEDAGSQSFLLWASSFEDNDDSELQLMNFTISNDNNDLFLEQPWVDSESGDLHFTSTENKFGEANVTITLSDNGGTENGGVDTSEPVTFKITVNSVNDAPSFTKGADQIIEEDAGSQTITDWATNLNDNDPDEEQILILNTSNDNNDLFSSQPAIEFNTGNLIYTPAPNANGTAIVSVTIFDNGGTANGGIDSSDPQTFTITVNPINDAPEFITNPVTLGEENTEYLYNIIATDSDQNASINITALLKPEWLILTDNGDGTATLKGTPQNEDVGDHDVILEISDGIAEAVIQSYKITVENINTPPSFSALSDISICPGENSGVINLLDFVTDEDASETFSFTQTSSPVNGVLVDLTGSNLNISHNATNSGTFDIEVKVTDSGNASDVATISVTIFFLEANISLNGNMLTASAGTSYKWFKDGNLMSGESDQSITAHEVGAYKVEITYGNDCSSTSAEINIDAATGLSFNDLSDKINIYPNPVVNELILNPTFELKGNTTIQIIDINGKVVLSKYNYQSKLNLASLSKGIYILQLINGNQRAIKKFVKY